MTARSPLVLAILDGWGINPRREANAIALAHTPTFDMLMQRYPHTALQSSGIAVGLTDGQMGNSEVGHQNIGTGTVIEQSSTRVEHAIRDGSFATYEALLAAFAHVEQRRSTLHLCGLIGTGGVHAHQSHLFALLELAVAHNVQHICIHAITDGRDSAPTAGIGHIRAIEEYIASLHYEEHVTIATIGGRYYYMDRDTRWDRTTRAWQAITASRGNHAASAVKALDNSYSHSVTDEFILPTVLADTPVQAGDAIIFWNTRPDRMRQLVKLFVLPELSPQVQEVSQRTGIIPDLFVATMTEYEAGLPMHVVFPSVQSHASLASCVAEAGMKQFHIAETEKYAHVTYFLNGGREAPFPNEERLLIPSIRVPTYDLQPEMSAVQSTDEVVARIQSGLYDLIVVNYANADMVGHTGNLLATIRAVETIDHCLARVVSALQSIGGSMVLTADHGNAEQLLDYTTGEPFTSHTTFPVPCILMQPEEENAARTQNTPSALLRSDGVLADISPTLLQLLHISRPDSMTNSPLLM